MKSEESIDNHRVVHGSAALLQNCESLVVRQFRSIRTIRGQRVKTINDRENSSPDRDCCCFDAGWIAGSIPVFMMVTNDGNHWEGETIAEKMAAPTVAWGFIFWNSASVNLPGLFRMYSGTASFPMSCSKAAACIAFSKFSSRTPTSFARLVAWACTRRM